VQDVADGRVSYVDDAGEQAADFVAGQWDQCAGVGIGSPFAICWARVRRDLFGEVPLVLDDAADGQPPSGQPRDLDRRVRAGLSCVVERTARS
jgi:hypothetical protein